MADPGQDSQQNEAAARERALIAAHPQMNPAAQPGRGVPFDPPLAALAQAHHRLKAATILDFAPKPRAGLCVLAGGGLNTPIFRLPLWAAGLLLLAAPVSLVLRIADDSLRPAPLWLLVASGIGFAAALVIGGVLQFRRSWLKTLADGFTIGGRRSPREVRYDQVIGLAVTQRDDSPFSGFQTSRQCRIWFDDGRREDVLTLQWRHPMGSVDPLAAFVAYLVQRVHARAEQALAEGQTFGGDGWELSYRRLRLGPRTEPLAFDEIAACTVLEGKLLVWKQGGRRPILKQPSRTRNAPILSALLDLRMSDAVRWDEERVAEAAKTLGAVLFQRRRTFRECLWSWCLLVLMSSFFGALGVMAFTGVLDGSSLMSATERLQHGYDPVLVFRRVVGSISWLLAAVCILPTLDRQFAVFRCHEFGVSRRNLMGRMRQVRYADLRAVTCRLQSPRSNEYLIRFLPLYHGQEIEFVASATDPSLTVLWNRLPDPPKLPKPPAPRHRPRLDDSRRAASQGRHADSTTPIDSAQETHEQP